MKKPKILIGRRDIIDLPEFGLFNVNAKVDTGAYTSAIHCSKIKKEEINGKKYISFYIPGSRIQEVGEKKFTTEKYKLRNIKSSSGHIEKRYVITTEVLMFNKLIKTEFSLTDRSTMKNPILLGRKLLGKKFLVDVSQINLSFKNKQK